MLVPSSGGAFEVTYGDRLLHSKKATRRDPSLRLVLAEIQAIVDAEGDAEPA
jgi:predicted Rdx family selenoprotein